MSSSFLRILSSSAAALSRWKLHPAAAIGIGLPRYNRGFCSSSSSVEESSTPSSGKTELLNLEEVKKILNDVHADDIKVIPVPKHYDFADHMVIATGRSEWHVRNIAQALIYRVKQKQKGAKRMVLPNVEGQEVGKWIVIDSGNLVIHALDEKVRAYYNLEEIWSSPKTSSDLEQAPDLEKAFVKIRPKNNSKKRPQPKA
ncbi:OLC1v1028722C1 [Oldenlandia corymbosa var. corymbosa]|uniref:OLC1v1028722C1 n=1 Tax=Oldenlandia corymbosa var. corymbosa TaxID=529605 RepID=A0AAV1CCC2_OLDCO|nr:OLC1v1028722C1 [Oldenlandia corymbosa var. corymbosa]